MPIACVHVAGIECALWNVTVWTAAADIERLHWLFTAVRRSFCTEACYQQFTYTWWCYGVYCTVFPSRVLKFYRSLL